MNDDDKPVILCVDDEPFILRSLARTMRREGYTILTTEGGDQALQILESEHVDLVIADHRMPGMSGDELLEQVHARYPQVILFMLSGYSVDPVSGAAAGLEFVRCFLPKPWRNQELKDAVREALEQREQPDEERA